MGKGPAMFNETTRGALPRAGKRDAWLEQRLSYVIGEQARLKAGTPLRRFLRGARSAYCRFQAIGDPAHRFHCGTTLQAVGAGLRPTRTQGGGYQVPGSAPDGPGSGPSLAAGLTDRAP
jgi:hypothetical protein